MEKPGRPLAVVSRPLDWHARQTIESLHMFRTPVLSLAFLALLSACGGGGGSSDSAPPARIDYPTLVQSGEFTLPTITSPPDRSTLAGTQRGRVLLSPGVTAPAGLTVEWLNASVPDAPQIRATTATGAEGDFLLTAQVSGIAAADQWLRVTLPDGTRLRAFATGWSELSPASEVAVREIARLRRAGAFTAHVLESSELAGAQESLGLVWAGSFGSLNVPGAVAALMEYLRFFAPWNQLLDKLALPGVNQGAGDMAGLMPVGAVTWPSDVARGIGSPASTPATFRSICFTGSIAERSDCSISSNEAPDLGEALTVRRTGISLKAEDDTSTALGKVMSEVGELALIEFPHVVGARTLYDNPRFEARADDAIHASVKITRRTYPVEAVQALGRSVQAVRVVLDYEIALLDRNSQKQRDLLVREQRWFSPQGGRVRAETLARVRDAGQVVSDGFAVAAESVDGSFFAGPAPPFGGVANVRSLGIRHRHALYSAVLDRIYVATATGQGQILELNSDTLQTLRTVDTGSVPGRLALSADGTRLYAGLDGGQVVEWRVSDLTQVRHTTLPLDPYGVPYDRVYDLSVDPFDPARVLVLAGMSNVFGGSGAVLVYRDGALVLRDAPRYYAFDYGWGYYSLNAISWSTVRDEYLGAFNGSPMSLFRFKTGATSTSEVASLLRVDDLAWRDVAGEILTHRGTLIDAATLSPVRALALGPFALRDCNRLVATTDLCEIGGLGVYPPFLVHFDHLTGAFLGTYRPSIADITNGCPEVGVREGSLGLDDRVLSPMTGGRSLVSTLTTNDGQRCSLQVWGLQGVNL